MVCIYSSCPWHGVEVVHWSLGTPPWITTLLQWCIQFHHTIIPVAQVVTSLAFYIMALISARSFSTIYACGRIMLICVYLCTACEDTELLSMRCTLYSNSVLQGKCVINCLSCRTSGYTTCRLHRRHCGTDTHPSTLLWRAQFSRSHHLHTNGASWLALRVNSACYGCNRVFWHVIFAAECLCSFVQ